MIFYKVENKGVFFLAAAAAAAAGVFISRRRAHPCTETGTHTAAVPKYRQISGEGAGAVSALKGLYHTIGRGSAGGRKYQFPDIFILEQWRGRRAISNQYFCILQKHRWNKNGIFVLSVMEKSFFCAAAAAQKERRHFCRPSNPPPALRRYVPINRKAALNVRWKECGR